MKTYEHDAIQNQYDIRLVDCFIKQNPNNNWLQPKDVAAWVFQTNAPSGHQITYCQRKLSSILGMAWTSQAEKSFLEKGRSATNPYVYVYRLKDGTQLAARKSAKKNISQQIEEAISTVRVADQH